MGGGGHINFPKTVTIRPPTTPAQAMLEQIGGGVDILFPKTDATPPPPPAQAHFEQGGPGRVCSRIAQAKGGVTECFQKPTQNPISLRALLEEGEGRGASGGEGEGKGMLLFVDGTHK